MCPLGHASVHLGHSSVHHRKEHSGPTASQWDFCRRLQVLRYFPIFHPQPACLRAIMVVLSVIRTLFKLIQRGHDIGFISDSLKYIKRCILLI